MVYVRRKDNSLRLIIDYWMTNSKSVTDSLHPISLIYGHLDRLGRPTNFGRIYAQLGYHQMSITKGDSDNKVFMVLFRYCKFAGRVPFGPKRAGIRFNE